MLVGLTLATFGGVLGNHFVCWDDNSALFENPDLNPPTSLTLLKFWADPLHGYRGFYVPVTYTVWWAAAHVAPVSMPPSGATMSNPAVFHGLNLAFHVAAALVTFRILRRLVGADLPALLGASLFALHPLQADPVCWASSMYTPLSGLLALSALSIYLHFSKASGKFATAPQESGKRRWMLYAAATACYALALLTKPTIILLPAVVAMIEIGLRGRRVRDCWPLLPWLVVAAADAGITRHTQAAIEVFVPPLWERPLIAADALAFYLKKLILPLDLIPDYGRSPRWAVTSGPIAVAWVVPTLIGIACWRLRRGAPWLWVGATIFLAGLLPTLGLTPFDYQFYSTVADRYAYFSLFGAGIIGAFAMQRVLAVFPTSDDSGRVLPKGAWRRPVGRAAHRSGRGAFSKGRLMAVAGAELICLVLALLSRAQTRYWRETRALFAHTLDVNPKSLIAHRQLGFVMLLGQDPAEAELAIAHYRAALAMYPDDGGALSNIGILLMRQQRPAEAVEFFLRAVRLRIDQAPLHYNLGNALFASGRCTEASNAYAQAMVRSEAFFDADQRLADQLAAGGVISAARVHYEAQLRVRPGNKVARAGLARLAAKAAGARTQDASISGP